MSIQKWVDVGDEYAYKALENLFNGWMKRVRK